MKYDYIARLETLQTDLMNILPHLDAVKYSNIFPAIKLHTTGDNRYASMYKTLSDSVLQPIFDKYKADADMFGYKFDEYRNKKINIFL